jgi:hypothetical protein
MALEAGRAANIASPGPTPELELVRAAGRTVRRGPYRLVRLVQPGRRLEPATKRQILETMIPRGSLRMLEGYDIHDYWSGRGDYLDGLDEWTLLDYDGDLVGWCGVCVHDGPAGRVMYIDTLGVMPGHRRRHVAGMLVFEAWWRTWRGHGPLPAMTLRTQSPVVFAMLLRFLPDWTYPRLPGLVPDLPPRAVAALRQTVELTSPGKPFDPRTGIVRGALDYAGSLYGRRLPRSGHEALDRFFDREMDAADGDSIVACVLWDARALARALAAYAIVRRRLVAPGGAA